MVKFGRVSACAGLRLGLLLAMQVPTLAQAEYGVISIPDRNFDLEVKIIATSPTPTFTGSGFKVSGTNVKFECSAGTTLRAWNGEPPAWSIGYASELEFKLNGETLCLEQPPGSIYPEGIHKYVRFDSTHFPHQQGIALTVRAKFKLIRYDQSGQNELERSTPEHTVSVDLTAYNKGLIWATKEVWFPPTSPGDPGHYEIIPSDQVPVAAKDAVGRVRGKLLGMNHAGIPESSAAQEFRSSELAPLFKDSTAVLGVTHGFIESSGSGVRASYYDPMGWVATIDGLPPIRSMVRDNRVVPQVNFAIVFACHGATSLYGPTAAFDMGDHPNCRENSAFVGHQDDIGVPLFQDPEAPDVAGKTIADLAELLYERLAQGDTIEEAKSYLEVTKRWRAATPNGSPRELKIKGDLFAKHHYLYKSANKTDWIEIKP